MKSKNLLIRMERDLFERFSEASKLKNESKSQIIRKLVEKWILEKEGELRAKSQISFIGVGGAGIHSLLRTSKDLEINFTAVSTDKENLNLVKNERIKKILLGEEETKGLGCKGDVKLGSEIAEKNKKLLSEELNPSKLVFISLGLGGGTGTAITPVVADIMRKKGAVVVFLIALPFKVESKRFELSKKLLSKFYDKANSTFVFSNNRLVDICPDLPIEKAFSKSDESISAFVNSIISFPSKNLFDSDYNAILSLLEEGHFGTTSSFVYSSSLDKKGIIRLLKKNLLFDLPLNKAKSVFVDIKGVDEIPVKELDKISDSILDEIGVKSQFFFNSQALEENKLNKKEYEIKILLWGVDKKDVKNIY